MSITTEYVDELIAKSTPIFIQSLQSILFEESKLCKNKKYLLRDFQTRLENIATWSPEVIQEEYLRFQHMSRCDWLDKLIHVSIVSMADRISSKGFDENMIALPDKANFIHKCYVNIAREVWRKPIIMYTGAKSKDKIRYTHELKEFIRKSIVTTIREFIPFDKLISTVLNSKRYSLQKSEESVSVEDVTTSELKEEPLMITQHPLYLEGGESNPEEGSVRVVLTGKELIDSEKTCSDDIMEDNVPEEPMEEDAAKEGSADEIMEEGVVEEGSADEIMEEPVVEEPAVEEPAVEEPAVEEPVVEASVMEEPAVEEPVVEASVMEEPVVEASVMEEPVVEASVMEEPAVTEASTNKGVVGVTNIILQEDSDSDEVGDIEIKLQDNLEDLKFKLKEVLSRDTNGIELKRKNKKKLVREMLKNRSVQYVQ